MRLFSAIGVPTQIHEHLMRLQSGLAGAKWRPRENFHITLQFYGDVKPEQARELEDALQTIQAPTLSLRVSGLGTFGRKRPFVLWAGVDGKSTEDQQQLRSLAADCFSAGQSAGIQLKRSNYTPHITLAYCKGVPDQDIAQYLQAQSGFLQFDFTSDHFGLYLSRLGKMPSRYEIISEFGPSNSLTNID